MRNAVREWPVPRGGIVLTPEIRVRAFDDDPVVARVRVARTLWPRGTGRCAARPAVLCQSRRFAFRPGGISGGRALRICRREGRAVCEPPAPGSLGRCGLCAAAASQAGHWSNPPDGPGSAFSSAGVHANLLCDSHVRHIAAALRVAVAGGGWARGDGGGHLRKGALTPAAAWREPRGAAGVRGGACFAPVAGISWPAGGASIEACPSFIFDRGKRCTKWWPVLPMDAW